MIFGAGITLMACAPQATETISDVNDEIPSSSVAEGKVLYQGKCSKCHDLKTIKAYTTDQWANILPKMSIKAKINDEQQALVNEYIQWELAH